MPEVAEISVENFMALPIASAWGNRKYKSLFIVSTGEAHDSGWMHMAIVGCQDGQYEVVAYCDDIEWDVRRIPISNEFRMDCVPPSGMIHVWAKRGVFQVGPSLSTTTIEWWPE